MRPEVTFLFALFALRPLTVVIETLESARDDWFAVGVQFHPEPDAMSHPELRIFAAFLDDVIAAASEAAAAREPQFAATGADRGEP